MLHWSSFTRAGKYALTGVVESFAPRKDATSKEIRINGLMAIGIGVAFFGSSILLLRAKYAPESFMLLPIFFGYAFIAVGGYRLIRGRSPAPEHAYELSISRILLGKVGIVVS